MCFSKLKRFFEKRFDKLLAGFEIIDQDRGLWRKKMILYFSATGNCKYVATRLVESTGEETVSIVDCIKDGKYSFRDKQIGIISPTYIYTRAHMRARTHEKILSRIYRILSYRVTALQKE